MDTKDDAVPSTARLNFGGKATDTQPVHTPDAEVPIAAQDTTDEVETEVEETPVDVQDEAMTAEAEAEPVETTEAEIDTGATDPRNDPAHSTQVDEVEEVAAVAEPEEDAASEPEEAAVEPEAEDTTHGTEAAAPEADEQVEPDEVDTDPDIEVEAPAATSDGDTKTVEELTAKRERLDAEIKAKQDAQKASVIAQIKTVVDTYSIPVDELVEALGGLKSKRKGVKAKQKFRDPASGATWSGRGKEPAWIKGQNRDDFLIPEDEQE